MQKPPQFDLFRLLHLPLRDALRGVATFADATEEALEPAANLFPDPVRKSIRSALHALDDQRVKVMEAPITHEDILRSADVLMGRDDTATAHDVFAEVIGLAWERLRPAMTDRHVMISETLLARHMANLVRVSGETPAQRAAAIIQDLRRSSVIGRLPGMSAERDDDTQRAVDLTLVAILVWLLAARADSLAEEQQLLDLACALLKAMQLDVLEAVADPAALSRQLHSLSAHL